MAEDYQIYGKPLDSLITESEGQGHLLEYQPGNTIIHRLNPITKLVLSLGLIVIAFLMPDFKGPLVLVLLLSLVAIVTGVFRSIAKILAFAGLPLALSLLLIQGLLYPGNETAFFVIGSVPLVDQLTFYEEGLLFALLFLFRIATLMLSLLLVIVTTHPKRMTTALMDRGMSNKFAYVFLASLQLIPEVQNRARSILEAQQARGLDTKANIRKRLKSVLALFTPLMISMLIATETRALALESRGFTRDGERSALIEVPDTRTDSLLRATMVLAVIAVAVWRFLV
ncbi:energy-coupling factor transporter transmembrane component T family protein [Natrinema halophilum]|uniref:Energy-coupling factor transporter transmembrane protein EcfT n=1 Tax=Natrinema halophilum TaxID=1699371 RepID=A0A7D5GU55_9EURY|nr:energy-coupling factor transporter transmembrane component T [Natrinema halophilum]QLG49826.1 energy-coupling factor transporter transmembrane protein EcfT [Natrinema halophilum]